MFLLVCGLVVQFFFFCWTHLLWVLGLGRPCSRFMQPASLQSRGTSVNNLCQLDCASSSVRASEQSPFGLHWRCCCSCSSGRPPPGVSGLCSPPVAPCAGCSSSKLDGPYFPQNKRILICYHLSNKEQLLYLYQIETRPRESNMATLCYYLFTRCSLRSTYSLMVIGFYILCSVTYYHAWNLWCIETLAVKTRQGSARGLCGQFVQKTGIYLCSDINFSQTSIAVCSPNNVWNMHSGKVFQWASNSHQQQGKFYAQNGSEVLWL